MKTRGVLATVLFIGWFGVAPAAAHDCCHHDQHYADCHDCEALPNYLATPAVEVGLRHLEKAGLDLGHTRCQSTIRRREAKRPLRKLCMLARGG
jgi:hypothetical protein